MEPTDVKTMVQRFFAEASPTSTTKKIPFSDDHDLEDDSFELCMGWHPRKTIKTEDHFTKDWLAASLNYFICLGKEHEWSFGAIAQLVDNAKDAQATKLEISIDTHYSKGDKNIPIMSIVDNGHDMSHRDRANVMYWA